MQSDLSARSGIWFFPVFAMVLLGLSFAETSAEAQVRFVQVTDPHIFDAGEERPENHAAFASTVAEISRRATMHRIEFVVVTGDLGIEELVSRRAAGSDGRREELPEPAMRNQALQRGAADLTHLLLPSRVGLWLFVPGNNDLVDERPDTISYYQFFLKHLQSQLTARGARLRIVDLTPRKTLESGVLRIGPYAFVGFDNASFKNQNQPARRGLGFPKAQALSDPHINLQVMQVDQVARRLAAPYVYLFFHIPDIDDPHLARLAGRVVLNKRFGTENPGRLPFSNHPYSAWFVHERVRGAWEKVVRAPQVRGLFTGHFHDPSRAVYTDLHWLRDPTYPAGHLTKLYPCPPLSVRFQGGAVPGARGFQEVEIDTQGDVRRRILWYTPAHDGMAAVFIAEPPEAQADPSFRLGQALEKAGRLEEAEAAFRKGLESSVPNERIRSLAALEGLVARRGKGLHRYLLVPLGEAIRSFINLFMDALPVLLLFVFSWLLAKGLRRRFGRGRLEARLATATDHWLPEHFVILVGNLLERMRGQAQGRGIIRDAKLPLLVEAWDRYASELPADLVPGPVGKVLGWTLQRLYEPEYRLLASFQVVETSAHLIVRLDRFGRPVDSWNTTCPVGEVLDKMGDFAYLSLIRVKRLQRG